MQNRGWVYGIWGIGLALLGLALWKTQTQESSRLAAFEREPEGIMGTSCRLLVVMDYREAERAEKILDKAEFQLRYIESLASNWIEHSEISRFNVAEPGEYAFSKVNWEILDASQKGFFASSGAFDVTCRPLIDLWKHAAKKGKVPEPQELAQARAISSWEQLELDRQHRLVRKLSASVAVDLGGVAKGYAIDVALEAMSALGVAGALVDVGGDVRVYGNSARDSGAWRFQIRSPDSTEVMSEFELAGGGAVCTSGDYVRYVEIEGVRYSHIVDPVSGYPARQVPSVTVVAPTALQSDIWATALSVLGKRGMELLPPGVEAQLLFRETGSDATISIRSDGFPDRVEGGS